MASFFNTSVIELYIVCSWSIKAMQNNFLYCYSNVQIKLTTEPHRIVNMMVDVDKSLNKDVFHTLKTTVDFHYCPLKSLWNKINYVNFCKLAQITKKIDNCGKFLPPFDTNLSSTSVTQNHLLTLHRLLVFNLSHFKVNSFWWWHWWHLRWCKQ